MMMKKMMLNADANERTALLDSIPHVHRPFSELTLQDACNYLHHNA